MAYEDLITFGKLFSPQDYLASESPTFHHEVGKLLLDKEIQKLALVLPRDHAKSTLASTAVLHRFLFATKEEPEFICWIGEAQDQAIDNLQWVQRHIYENPAIHYYFGDLIGDTWTKTNFTLRNGCRMLAKGTSQRLRGKKEFSTRYTGIILDDFESELNTKTAEGREAIKNWVTAAVYPAIDFDKRGFLWCNGTIVHWASLLNELVEGNREAQRVGEQFSWKVYEKKATEDGQLEDNSTPIWPSRWPIKKLQDRRQFFIDSGTPAKFYQEYMNQARSPEDQIFSEEDIKKGFYEGVCKFDSDSEEWYIEFADNSKSYVNLYVGVDPASTLGVKSDFSVIMVVGVTNDNDYYVIDFWRAKVLPMDCAEEIFTTYTTYKGKIKRFNIETIAYQEMLRDYVKREMKKRGIFIPGIEQGIKNYGNQKKKDRLFEGLQPMFKSGVVHLKRSHGDFVNELLDFPKGGHDDLIDGFWLAMQYSRGSALKKAKEKTQKLARSVRKRYNWMTGAKIN